MMKSHRVKSKLLSERLTRAQFRKKLIASGYEDLETIDAVEQLLKAKRGFVAKLPPPGGSVILMLSGGIDSLTTWALLMDHYKLHVYPFFMYQKPKWPWQENKSTRELEAIRIFIPIYQKKFPEFFHTPAMWETKGQVPSPLSKVLNNHQLLHPEQLLEEFLQKKQFTNINHFFAWEFAVLHATQFSEYLKLRSNLKIPTICTGLLYGDGKMEPSQRFTSLRASTLLINLITGSWDKTILSPIFENTLGKAWNKTDIIRYGSTQNLPLEKTWSCQYGEKIHCGTCPFCWYRKENFKKSSVKDNTAYKKFK